MPKKIAKIMVDGTEMNKCHLCGQGVNVSAWNKWKMCIHCHKLSQQGLNLERIKRIRATELSGEILTTDEDSDELSKIYSKQEVYNFHGGVGNLF